MALTPIRFRLDWVWQAPQSIWTLAHERGYFKEEGLDVTIDRGYGGSIPSASASAPTSSRFRISTMRSSSTAEPDHKVKCVFAVYDATLAAIITREQHQCEGLEGRSSVRR
jgi:NitT/TauT family transport system substrate-binding protein